MKPLTMTDIMPNDQYETQREAFRRHIIRTKRVRRVAVGPRVTIVLENRDTMRFQIQEMLRIEKIVAPEKIQEEIEIYNDLLPSGHAIGATLLIELSQDDDMPTILKSISGLEYTVFLTFGERTIQAQAEAGRSTDETTSSVHYLRFTFAPDDHRRLADAPTVNLGIAHPNYPHTTLLEPATVAALIQDIFLA